jgi:hypothetical protein
VTEVAGFRSGRLRQRHNGNALHAVRAKPVAVDVPSAQHCDRIADHFAAMDQREIKQRMGVKDEPPPQAGGKNGEARRVFGTPRQIVAGRDDVNFLAELAHRIRHVRPFSYTQAEYDRLLKLCSRDDKVAT